MEKLSQLSHEADEQGTWDLIVVDTPPSRSALDFLDAPQRLGSFLDGRFIRLLMAPAKAGGRTYLKVVSGGITMATSVMTKLLGGQMLQDVQTFVAALDTMFGGFRQRAEKTYALLGDGRTAFVVVATPERDALREASYFVQRLDQEQMPLAGVIVNRVQHLAAPGLTSARADAAAEVLGEASLDGTGSATAALTEGLLRVHADLAESAERHHAQMSRFVAGHPGIPLTEIPAAASDIHDLDGLRTIGAALTAARG